MSYKLQRSVTDLILQVFLRTMVFAFSAALVSWVIGIPAGILSAINQYSATDYFLFSAFVDGTFYDEHPRCDPFLGKFELFGVGAQPPTPSWGLLVSNGKGFLFSAPWVAILPGVTIFITVLAFNFIGDGLRDAIDPYLKV